MLTDSQRHDLYMAALNSWGQGPADALMSMIPPGGWDDVARKGDLVQLRAHIDLQLARLARGNVISMFAVAGLVLAAAKLA